MLAVIFFLLKTIGLILKGIGILLLIILLILALIAFVPIRYRFEAVVPKEKKDSCVNVRVNWFGFLLVAKGSYVKGNLDYLVKIFGHQILGNQPAFLKAQEEKEKKKKDKPKKNKQKKRKPKKKKRKAVEEKTEVSETKELSTMAKEKPKVEPQPKAEVQKTSQKQSSKEMIKDKKKSETKESSEGILSKGKDFVNEIKDIWEEYHISENLPFVKEILLKTLKHVLPKKWTGHLEVGLQSPEWMGYLTAGMAMMYPVYGKHLLFTPYFQETKLEADCKGRGGIQLGFFVYIGIRLVMNKEIRKIIFG